MISEEAASEFWNHDDEASGSEEDISDYDDGVEVAKSLARSRIPLKSGLDEKIEFLQHAEEIYYQKKHLNKQVSKADKNTISEEQREASRQRLLNALTQTRNRLSNLKIELETSATFLEHESYQKYGKTGKSFYYSQVASIVRWLSTTNSTDLSHKLSSGTRPSALENATSNPDQVSMNEGATAISNDTDNGFHSSVKSQSCLSTLPMEIPSQDVQLPPVPSFSEFIKSRKEDDCHVLATRKKSPAERVVKKSEKRMRLQ